MSHLPPTNWYQAWGKRLLDVVLSGPLLVATLPLVLLAGGFFGNTEWGADSFSAAAPWSAWGAFLAI